MTASIKAICAAGVVACLLGASPLASAATVRASLDGFSEVPSIFTLANGDFRAKIRLKDGTLAYRLSYEGFDTFVRFAHIHFSARGTNGGVIVFLCDNLGVGPDGTPPCPQESGSVSGEIDGDDVVGPDGQGISPGDFSALVEAIFAGTGYVNVHSDRFSSGEIRGQIRGRQKDDDDDDD